MGLFRQVTCSRGVLLVADKLLPECTVSPWDLIVLPGGHGGAEKLRASKLLQDLLEKQLKDEKFIGAICAAPAVVLSPLMGLWPRKMTCYPSKQFIGKNEGSMFVFETSFTLTRCSEIHITVLRGSSM
jgi:4-methyl-5(b-hydroxyethyl)-thiazole monophosphate biosynthesis